MEKNVLIGFLKVFTLKNKINIKIDDVDEVIEVLDDNFDEKILVNQLRETYNNVNKN
jgi:hypothetical protein